jgi:nucleoid DNA-binding protein
MKKEENKIFIDEFCEKVAKKTGTEDDKAKKFVHNLFDLIGSELEKEEKVQIYQFGIFKKKWAQEKPGINPQTKEKIVIPAHNKISFKPSKLLADEVNRKYRHLKPNVMDEILTLTGLRKITPEDTKVLERDTVLKEEHGKAKKRALITLIVSGIILLVLLSAIILIPVFYNNVEDNNVVNFVKNVNQMLGLNSISEKLSGSKNEQIDKEKVSEFLKDSKKDLLQGRNIIDTYTVKKGDSIFSIAKNYWENEYLWPDLYILNKEEFSDPDLIFPNDKITVYEKLGEPDKFSRKQKDQIVQAYIGIYRIYRALGEKDLADGKAAKDNNKIAFGEKRVNDSRWTLYTAIRYDHDLLKKYKDAIYPEDIEILQKYIDKFGYQGKKDK